MSRLIKLVSKSIAKLENLKRYLVNRRTRKVSTFHETYSKSLEVDTSGMDIELGKAKILVEFHNDKRDDSDVVVDNSEQLKELERWVHESNDALTK